MKNKWYIFSIIIFILLFSLFGDVYSKENDSIDVVLVMDSSGSMKKTDPMSLRIPAAKLFISLLDKNDRASVVSFSDTSYPIIHLTKIDSVDNKDQLLRAADKISSAGLFTNLYDALDGGLRILSEGENSGNSKIIVLMSDGMMDVGDIDKDRELVEKINNEMAATLEEKGIKVYTIAFTEQSDRLLLEKISKRTGGFYNLALSDKDFHLIFTSIFESLKSPDMAPISENGFFIDGSIEEVTIVATKGSPKTQIRLNAPDGRSYSNKEKSTGIGWFVSDNFDMITIKTPGEGRWDILFSTGENNKAYIITNLKLQTNFDQLYSTFGDPLDIKIWLEKDGIAIKEKELLDKFDIYLEMTGPDGSVSKMESFNKGDGIFERNIAPFTPGNYKLRIIAQGNTFEREKAFVFNIANAKESREDIQLKRERDKKAQEQTNNLPVNDKITSDFSWKKIIMQFVLINMAIGVFVLVYLKRKSLKEIKGIKSILSPARLKNLMKKNKSVISEREDVPEKVQSAQEKPQIEQEGGKGEEEVKHTLPAKQKEDTGLDVKEADENTEEQAGVIEQKEEEAQIKEIPLEEDDKGGGNIAEQETAQEQQEAISEGQKQEVLQGDINEEKEIYVDSHGEQLESTQHILNQDDLDELLGLGGKASGQGKEEQMAEFKSDSHDEGNSELVNESGSEDKLDHNDSNEDIEDMDKLWEEALKTQKNAEAGDASGTEGDQIAALDLEIERLEKAKKEEINLLPNEEGTSVEVVGMDEEHPESVNEPGGEDKLDQNDSNEDIEDMDKLWQEALKTQKDAEAGDASGTEGDQVAALDLEIERLEKEEKGEITQRPDKEDGSIEEETNQNTDSNLNAAPSGEKVENNIDNEQEDIDAIWQEAMKQQKAAEDEAKDNKKSTASD
ncbi:MAG: VWA domain-containing protein [Nitrospiraceae bacterium]|nr:MAG: VWA domain-containing protein [Nitrospiraceae bacterium]